MNCYGDASGCIINYSNSGQCSLWIERRFSMSSVKVEVQFMPGVEHLLSIRKRNGSMAYPSQALPSIFIAVAIAACVPIAP
jgi:hypothetical protein